MAYYAGAATSASDLRTAIINACTTEGWTNPADGYLYKDPVYVNLSIYSGTSTDGLLVAAGTSYSAGLVNETAEEMGLRENLQGSGSNVVGLNYPCTYYVFINTSPDDVVVAVNYSTTYWQWMAFGQSSTISQLSGSGIYCTGSGAGPGVVSIYDRLGFYMNNPYTDSGIQCQKPFFYGRGYSTYTSYIYLDLDSQGWWVADGSDEAYTYYTVYPYMAYQPNTWNNESVLLRSWITVAQASGFYAYVAELPHVRFLRNTYIDDGTIITLGSDNWFVAPLHRRNVSVPNGDRNASHTGTGAIAVRKTT